MQINTRESFLKFNLEIFFKETLVKCFLKDLRKVLK